jgi:hypothetical protein
VWGVFEDIPCKFNTLCLGKVKSSAYPQLFSMAVCRRVGQAPLSGFDGGVGIVLFNALRVNDLGLRGGLCRNGYGSRVAIAPAISARIGACG